MTLRVYRGAAGLAEIAPQWAALADRLSSPAINQSPQYYQSYARAFETGPLDCFVVALFRGSELAAAIPLRHISRRVLGLSVGVLTFPAVPMPIRSAALLPDVSFQAVFNSMVSGLATQEGISWDYLHLRGVLETSPIVAQGHYDARCRRILQAFDVSNWLDVSAPAYIDRRLNSKARNNLRRNQKKLMALGEHQFVTVTEMPALQEAFQRFLDTEAAGWKSIKGGKRAVKLHKDHTDFYYDLMCACAPRGKCHIHLLMLQGVAIASDFCILTKDRCYSLKHGYDENHSNVAPSQLLREYAVNRYCGDPDVNAIDLISGARWHSVWRPNRTKVYDVKLFNRTALALPLYGLLKARASKPSPGTSED